MTSHQLTVAKATFQASLLRPDPSLKSVEKDSISTFNQLFESTLKQCSPKNIQTCREWLCLNIVPARHRVTSFGKYLNVFIISVENIRARIHILYILNDVLHWQKLHVQNGQSFANDALQWLDQLLSNCLFSQSAKYQKRALDLLEIWQEKSYFTPKDLNSLRQAVLSSEKISVKETSQAVQNKDIPWIMPSLHGDNDTPFYDLPAANMIPLITPNSSRPIFASQLRPLKLQSGQVSKSLMLHVQDLLDEVDQIYNTTNSDEQTHNIDLMGQPIILNELGERIGSDSYYGWSRSFCENMHRKMMASKSTTRNESRSPSRSSSRSRSRSSRNRNRSHPLPSSRSPSRSGRPRFAHSRSRSPNYHDSRGTTGYRRSRSRSLVRDSRAPLSSAQRNASNNNNNNNSHNHNPSGLLPPHPLLPPPPAFLPPGMIPPPMVSGQIPIPLPRPAGWNGPWPPLPPPPPPMPSSNYSKDNNGHGEWNNGNRNRDLGR